MALKQAMTPEFRLYQRQVVANCRVLAETLMELGYKVVTGTNRIPGEAPLQCRSDSAGLGWGPASTRPPGDAGVGTALGIGRNRTRLSLATDRTWQPRQPGSAQGLTGVPGEESPPP